MTTVTRVPMAFAAVVVFALAPGPMAAPAEPVAPIRSDGRVESGRLEWWDGASLDVGRDHHATWLVERGPAEAYLYVAGGTDYRTMFQDVVRSAIELQDGGMGAWEVAGQLPSPRAGIAMIGVDGTAILTGGQIATGDGLSGLRRIAEVYTAPIGADGRLGAWREEAPLPEPRFHHPLVHHRGWVYVAGGQGAVEAEAGVYAARLTAEGRIREWVELTPLPRPRSHHAALVIDGHLYVFGGLDGRPGGHQGALPDVIRAPIAEDGTLGDWKTVSILPHAYATHSVIEHGGYVWLLGGVEDLQRFTDAIWRAAIRDDGRIGPWEPVEPGLPLARGHVHNTPVVGGRVYSVGGRVASEDGRPGVTGAVHIGTFADVPTEPPG